MQIQSHGFRDSKNSVTETSSLTFSLTGERVQGLTRFLTHSTMRAIRHHAHRLCWGRRALISSASAGFEGPWAIAGARKGVQRAGQQATERSDSDPPSIISPRHLLSHAGSMLVAILIIHFITRWPYPQWDTLGWREDIAQLRPYKDIQWVTRKDEVNTIFYKK